MLDPAQPREAGPAGDRVELIGVAERARRMPKPLRGVLAEGPGLAGRTAPGDVAHAEREKSRVVVTEGGSQHQRGERARRRAPEAGRGRAQHEPANTVWRAVGELLGERAAERVSEHIDALEVQRVEERGHDAGQASHPQREGRPLREAGARRVEGDQLAVAEESRERCPHVQVRADAGDEQEWPARAVAPDAQPQTRRPDLRVGPGRDITHGQATPTARGGAPRRSAGPLTASSTLGSVQLITISGAMSDSRGRSHPVTLPAGGFLTRLLITELAPEHLLFRTGPAAVTTESWRRR